ncbi:MAG: tetratricopeptide repeat protein [bacterium]|nr:tetratricopeptide repeat protein [bacterium]
MRTLFSRVPLVFFVVIGLLVSLAPAAAEVQGIEGIFQYAENLFKNQQYPAAETEYLQLLSIDSQYLRSDLARYRLGWCAYYLGKYELAVMQFTHLIKSYPKSSLIKDARTARQFIYEISEFVPTVDSDPASIPFNLARKEQAAENDLDALSFYERVVQNYPGSIYAAYSAYYIAQIHTVNYAKLSRSWNEKNADYQRAQYDKINPDIPVQLFAEAALQEELMHQQLQQTILAYARVTEQYPESFQRQLVHRDLAELYLKTGMIGKAKQEYQALLEITREFPNSLFAYQAQEKLKQIK